MIGWSALALGLGMVGAAAVLAAAALRLPSPISFALAAYLLGYGALVLVTEALSFPHAVGRGGYLAASTILLVGAAALWLRVGRPRPRVPPLALRAAVRAHPALAGLAAVVGAAVCYELVLILVAPPNNGDALNYHLSRAVAWLQEGGLHVVEHAHTARQNEFPPNAEIGFLATLALLGRDTAVALPELLAQCALAVGVAGLARRVGATRAAAVFAALLTACLTQVALQAVTTKNDLLVASFVVAAAYFVCGGGRLDVALAGLAVGLALGTKTTAVLALPTLALLALVTLPARRVAAAAAAAALGFAAVGAWSYASNVRHTESPLGNRYELANANPDVTLAGTASTAARIGFRFLDLSGFRVRTSWLEPVSDAGERAFELLRIPVNPPESKGYTFDFTINVVAHEDHSFFGPLGFLLVLPLAAGYSIAWALRRTSAARGVLALSLPLYMLLLAVIFRFSDEGRYLITPVALTMPLSAALYRRRGLAAGVAALGALTLVSAHASNALRPTGLDGTTPVWELSRADAIGLTFAGLPPLVEAVERAVPADARIAAVLGPNNPDYPFFGPRLERRLVAVAPDDPLRAAARLGIDWVVLGRGRDAQARPGWTRLAASEAGAVFASTRGRR